jgi:hypothetical protein
MPRAVRKSLRRAMSIRIAGSSLARADSSLASAQFKYQIEFAVKRVVRFFLERLPT